MSQKDSQATNSTAAAPETLAESDLDQFQGRMTTRIDEQRLYTVPQRGLQASRGASFDT